MSSSNETGKSTVAIRIAFILDEIRACNAGATSETADKIYTAFEPIYANLADIVNIFYNYQSVVVAVLELVCEMLQNLIYLKKHNMYEICMHIIMVYAKHNGSRVSVESSATEDCCEDLMMLLKLIDRLLSTNYIGVLGGFVQANLGTQFNHFFLFVRHILEDVESTIDATEVCVLGFQYIMPLITMDLLKFPTLCEKYYQSITVFIEAKSKKVYEMNGK